MHNLLVSSWHPSYPSANFCGKSCVQHVQGVRHAWVRFLDTLHTAAATTAHMWGNQAVVHGLYHFFTQAFPTALTYNSPLLNSQLYAVSTLSIMTTTKYIKE